MIKKSIPVVIKSDESWNLSKQLFNFSLKDLPIRQVMLKISFVIFLL